MQILYNSAQSPPQNERLHNFQTPPYPQHLNLDKNIDRNFAQIVSQALQAIKKYQARNSNIVSEKTKHLLSSPLTIFRQIDDHYTRLHVHKELKVEKPMRVQILPFNQEYFCIDTQLIIFPVRIFLRNVRNQGILYVGYDHEYPGVQRMNSDRDSPIKSDRSRGYQSQKRAYDCKFIFNKDVMCVLKNQKKKPIRKIYLTIVAKKQLVMLNLKFDYIGYENAQVQQIQNRPKRAFTQGDLFAKDQFQLPSPVRRNGATFYDPQNTLLFNNTEMNYIKRSNTEGPLSSLMQKAKSLEKYSQFSPIQQKKQKNFIKTNLNNILSHRRENSRQLLLQRKEKAVQSKERIKANKQQLEQYKEKQSQIKQMATTLKKAIQQYQKIYKQERVRDIKMLNLLTPLVYMTIFMQKSNKAYNIQTKSISKTFTVRNILKKFSKALRKRYIQSVVQIANTKARNQMSCLHFFQLSAKIVQPTTCKKAAELIFMAFSDLQPALVLNHALNQSTNYRQSVRTVQRRWLIKYRSRLAMLENFSNRHVQSMIKQYPHLRLGYQTFKSGNHCYKVCYQYMVDQSAKFRHIYNAYMKRVHEIEQFINKNYQIQQYNKGKPQSKKRAYLDIPMKPAKPQQRIFRNLDILKSMLRGWFEIEYKKILKKSTTGK